MPYTFGREITLGLIVTTIHIGSGCREEEPDTSEPIPSEEDTPPTEPITTAGTTGPDTTTTTTTTTEVAGPWEMVRAWHWPGWPVAGQNAGQNVFSPPAVGQLTDDDGDGDIDADDAPDVVATAFSAGGAVYVLVALDGRDGSVLWAIEGQTDQGSSVAVADVAGDAVPEVLTLGRDRRLVALTNQGDLLWRSDEPVGKEPYNSDPIVVADLDGDDAAEILVTAAIIDGETGVVASRLDLALNDLVQCVRPVVADLDQDGAPEILAGHRVFEADGTVRFEAPIPPPGNTLQHRSVAVQADADPAGEVLIYGGDPAGTSSLIGSLHDGDGTLLGSFEVPGDDAAGLPCAADVDGDGITEVIRPGASNTWMAMELDGTQIWRTSMPNDTGAPGCTLGDIDGDGALEVLLDGGGLEVLDAATGEVRTEPVEVGYGVQWGGGAMVDLDGDGSMELIVGANDYAHRGSLHGVIALSHTSGGWAAGARSWPTSSHTAGAFDAMGHPSELTAWWLAGDPYPGP